MLLDIAGSLVFAKCFCQARQLALRLALVLQVAPEPAGEECQPVNVRLGLELVPLAFDGDLHVSVDVELGIALALEDLLVVLEVGED